MVINNPKWLKKSDKKDQQIKGTLKLFNKTPYHLLLSQKQSTSVALTTNNLKQQTQ